MAFLQFFLDLSGETKRRELRIAKAKQEQEDRANAIATRDMEIAHSSFTRMGLPFRPHGYNENDWLVPPVQFPQGTKLLESNAGSLIHMNLHPLASYRAMGLSHVVDHWVPRVAAEGWALLTDNFGPFIRLGAPRQWGHIEHPVFWGEVAKLLDINDTNGNQTQELLRHAGWAGNTVPFEAVPRHHAEQYSKTAPTCHPRVALWLKAKGLWTKEQLVPSMGPWKDSFPLAGDSFMAWGKDSAITVAYVREWLDLMLMHYPLSQENKVGLVGQAILAFGKTAWERHFEPSARAHLADIDMSLLYSVCGLNAPLFATFNPKETKDTSLEKTVAIITQDSREVFSPNAIDFGRLQKVSNLHENLLLLLEIQPPQSRTELYMLADMARKMERGIIQAPETVALPDLSF